ncbi:sulfatase-like hydrolase/transferase [Nitrosopumilus sp.]|nr:sulfatase-like hydrolase/transferase [Nitrosopumilus sp.]
MKPNILFLVLDALPAKKCYENSSEIKIPNIKKLMKEGVVFKQAISSGDETPVSFASMFTAKFPFKGAIRPSLWTYKYRDNSNNYIKILKKNGYQTYATLPKLTAWKEIFSDFDIDYYLSHSDRLFNGLGEKILKKINEKEMNEPWFYLLHLLDSHKPINYPNEFDTNEFGIDEYERMMSYVDTWIGKFLEKIDLKNTIIIISADHGDYIRTINDNGKIISFEYKNMSNPTQKIRKVIPEKLHPMMNKSLLIMRSIITKIKLQKIGRELTIFEKRTLTGARSYANHFLFDELINVPLIMTGPGLKKGLEINNIVGLVDLFPTICDIIKINDKNSQQDGISLVELMEGKNIEERAIYSETSLNLKNKNEGGYGVRTSKYKYFKSSSKNQKNIHLYDLEKDPFEEVNIAEYNKKIVEKMENILTNLMSSETNDNEKDFIRKQIEKKRKKLLDN